MPSQTGNPLGRHYTRFSTLNARNRTNSLLRDPTLQREKYVLPSRNSTSKNQFQRLNCGSWASGLAHAGEVRQVVGHRVEVVYEPHNSVELHMRIRGAIDKGPEPALRCRAVRALAQGDNLLECFVLYRCLLYCEIAEDIVLRRSRRLWLLDLSALEYLFQ